MHWKKNLRSNNLEQNWQFRLAADQAIQGQLSNKTGQNPLDQEDFSYNHYLSSDNKYQPNEEIEPAEHPSTPSKKSKNWKQDRVDKTDRVKKKKQKQKKEYKKTLKKLKAEN